MAKPPSGVTLGQLGRSSSSQDIKPSAKVQEQIDAALRAQKASTGQSPLAGMLGGTASSMIGSKGDSPSDAKESGKQTGITGDAAKDIINALRDTQSDINTQGGLLKQNNAILMDQSNVLNSGFKSLIQSGEKTNLLLQQILQNGGMGGGGGLLQTLEQLLLGGAGADAGAGLGTSLLNGAKNLGGKALKFGARRVPLISAGMIGYDAYKAQWGSDKNLSNQDFANQYLGGTQQQGTGIGSWIGNQLRNLTGGPSQPNASNAPSMAPGGPPSATTGAPSADAVKLASTMVGSSAQGASGYMAAGGVNWQGEAWCADFVNATLKQTGQTGSGAKTANSFQSWGTNINPLQVMAGDVVLQTRGRPAGAPGGHVGIATGVVRGNMIEMIAGNSGGQVKKYFVPINGQLMVRRGTGAGSPGASPASAPPGAIPPSQPAPSAPNMAAGTPGVTGYSPTAVAPPSGAPSSIGPGGSPGGSPAGPAAPISPGAGPSSGSSLASAQRGATGGSRSWRNNNPGNIEFGPYAKSMGATSSDGRFAIFPSYESGRKAQEHLLFESKSYKNLTLGQAIGRWAPASENNVPAYIKAMGADPNASMSSFSTEQRTKLLDAMQKQEGWKVGKSQRPTGAAPENKVSVATASSLSPEMAKTLATEQDKATRTEAAISNPMALMAAKMEAAKQLDNRAPIGSGRGATEPNTKVDAQYDAMGNVTVPGFSATGGGRGDGAAEVAKRKADAAKVAKPKAAPKAASRTVEIDDPNWDRHAKSRAMFQAHQEAEARGESGTSAMFFAADKQRTLELGMKAPKIKKTVAVPANKEPKSALDTRYFGRGGGHTTGETAFGRGGGDHKAPSTELADSAAHAKSITATVEANAARDAAMNRQAVDDADAARAPSEKANLAAKLEQTQSTAFNDDRQQRGESLARIGAPIPDASGSVTTGRAVTPRNLAAAIGGGPEARAGSNLLDKSQSTEMGAGAGRGSVTERPGERAAADKGEDKSQPTNAPDSNGVDANILQDIFGLSSSSYAFGA